MRVELCLSQCHVPPPHTTAWIRRCQGTLPTPTGTVSLAARAILAPCFMLLGRTRPKIHPALFLPTRPVPRSSVLVKMTWPPKQLGKDRPEGQRPHLCKKKHALPTQLTLQCPAARPGHEDGQPSCPRSQEAGRVLACAERENCSASLKP